MVRSKRTPKTAAGCAVLQYLQPSELRTSKHGASWCSGKTLYPNWFRGADVQYVAADWTTWSRSGGRQQPSHDCDSSTVGVLSFHADREKPKGTQAFWQHVVDNALQWLRSCPLHYRTPSAAFSGFKPSPSSG